MADLEGPAIMSETIPLAALDNHIAILAKTGAGKSNAAKDMVEGLLDRGQRTWIIDPAGGWYGLRLTPKLKPSKYDIAIFGGRHGDLAIGPTHGAALAEMAGTSSTSGIIDTRSMTVKDRTRFFTDFAEALLRTNQGKLHLVVDEAHLFAPKGKVGDPQSGMMLNAANNLVSLGRGIGLCITLISQRPAKLHNDCLSGVETLVAMRMLLPHDKAAVSDWIRDQADPVVGKEIVASLPTLKTGEAWIWSPGLGLLARRKFPLVKTFDSGRPRATGEQGPELVPLDMHTITERLEAVAADVVANDPKHLKAEVARLQAELRKAPTGAPVDDEAARQRGYHEGWKRGVEESEERINQAYTAGQKDMRQRAADAAKEAVVELLSRDLPASKEPPKTYARPALAPPPQAKAPIRQPEPDPSTTLEPVKQAAAPGSLKPAQKKILDVLVWNENLRRTPGAAMEKPALAFNVGMAAGGGGFNNYLGALRSGGFIDYQDGGVVLTEEGRAIGEAPDAISNEQVQAVMLAKVKPAQQRIMNILIDMFPAHVEKTKLADLIGMAPGAGGFNNYLGNLRTMQMIEYPEKGRVAASRYLFPEAC